MAHVIKRPRFDNSNRTTLDDIKSMLENRLSSLEKKVDLLVATCSSILSSCDHNIVRGGGDSVGGAGHGCCATLLLPKIMLIDEFIKANIGPKSGEGCDLGEDLNGGGPVVLIPSGKPTPGVNARQVISLNSENDIPDGCWLGDKDDPKGRVRVNIPPRLLIYINERCQTPEKMALALLDYLFPREVQAISNISGKSKHSKCQLDPLKIYAIRCHLVYKFNISEEDWHRIKQNIDAKCRSVWRKKINGLPLETNKPNFPRTEPLSEDSDDCQNSAFSFSSSKLSSNRDQLLQLTSGQTVKVFTDEEFKELLPTSVELFSVDDSDCFTLSDEKLLTSESASPEKQPLDDFILRR